MNNKRLEDRLKKHGEEYAHIILLIEKCENGNVEEIRITKEEGITNSAILDKMILTYLKKLKIAVTYIDTKEAEESDDDGKPKCQNKVHQVLGSNMKAGAKSKALLKSKYGMLKIDATSYVICPTCFEIKEVK